MVDKRKADAARTVTKRLSELLRGYRFLMEDASRAEALTLPQLRLLHAVAEHNDASAAALARMCQVTPQTFQAMLTRAVREGWITRGTSDRNHRILTARLTSKGRAVLRRGMAMAQEIEEKIWKDVPLASLRSLNEVLGYGLMNLGAEVECKGKARTGRTAPS